MRIGFFNIAVKEVYIRPGDTGDIHGNRCFSGTALSRCNRYFHLPVAFHIRGVRLDETA